MNAMNRLSIEERRRQLIDAAMTIAARDGVESVTIRGVAAEAGVSLGVVHYCFEDKEALLLAVGHSVAMVASEPVRAAVRPGSLPEIAHAAAEGLFQGLIPRRHMRLLAFEFATVGARNRALRPVAHAHYQQTLVMTRGILEQLAACGGASFAVDLDFLTRLVAGYIDGIELAWLVEQDDAQALAAFHALADYCLSLMTRAGEPTDQPTGGPNTVSV